MKVNSKQKPFTSQRKLDKHLAKVRQTKPETVTVAPVTRLQSAADVAASAPSLVVMCIIHRCNLKGQSNEQKERRNSLLMLLPEHPFNVFCRLMLHVLRLMLLLLTQQLAKSPKSQTELV